MVPGRPSVPDGPANRPGDACGTGLPALPRVSIVQEGWAAPTPVSSRDAIIDSSVARFGSKRI